MAGNVQMAIIGADNAVPLAESGKLKALGVSTLKPSPLVPDVPPIADTLPGFEVVGFTAVLAPPGTPSSVIDRLNQEINTVLADPDTKQKLLGLNQEIVGASPDVLAEKIKADLTKWSKLVEEAGLKAE
jgi:tripartite-type tricarboxylate transporter receptor subunit TctC